jgi:hypothetical protein
MDYNTFLTPTLGVGGIVVLAVVMLMRGDIVPRKQIDTLLAAKDEQITLYRGLYEGAMTLHGRKDEQIAALMLTAQTTRRVLEAIPEAAGIPEGSSREVAPEAD